MVSHDILLSEIAKYHVSQPTPRWFRSYLWDRPQTCAISGVLRIWPTHVDTRRPTKLDFRSRIILTWHFLMICPCVYQLLTLKYMPMIQHYGLPITPSIIFLSAQFARQSWLNNASRVFTSNQMVLVPQKRQNNSSLPLDKNCNMRFSQYGNEWQPCRRSSHVTWHSHIEYLIGKLNSRIYLLKSRAKGYLSLHCRKLLFNAFVKPIFEYCCSVWGKAPNDQLLIIRVQKRWSRLILAARLLDNPA